MGCKNVQHGHVDQLEAMVEAGDRKLTNLSSTGRGNWREGGGRHAGRWSAGEPTPSDTVQAANAIAGDRYISLQ